MKVKKARKYARSFLAAIGACVILSGCGKTEEEVKAPEVIEININNPVVSENETQTTTQPEVVCDIPNIGFYNGDSIIEALDSINYDSSLESRKLLADRLAIANYTGTAEQNSQMLAILKYQAAQYRAYVEEQVTSTEWVDYDDEFEIRRNDQGKIEYRNHTYTSYVTVLGTDSEKRSCRSCGHEQYRTTKVETTVKWTAVDAEKETNGTEVRNHTYGGWITAVGTADQEKRTCATCGYQEFRTVGRSQKQ